MKIKYDHHFYLYHSCDCVMEIGIVKDIVVQAARYCFFVLSFDEQGERDSTSEIWHDV